MILKELYYNQLRGKQQTKGKTMSKPKKRTQGMNWIRKNKRLAIYLRDGMACAYCGSTIEDGITLTLDHITPYSKGGTNSESNLITCCGKCNSVRQDRNIEDWAKNVAGYIGNVSKSKILAYIKKQTSKKLTTFKKEANELMSRRASWTDCLK
jgi:5-methylcytosine-specific restriction endonuclease McrA